MPDSTALTTPVQPAAGLPFPAPTPQEMAAYMALKRRFPTVADLRREARRVLPNFAFEYADGGSGGENQGIDRNNRAFDAIEMVPRYGRVTSPPPAEVELFGRKYRAPIGIAPVGGPNTVFPGAET